MNLKRTLSLLLAALMCVTLFTACKENEQETDEITTTAATESESETAPQRPAFSASCIEKKGNRYVIVLPKSGEIIPVRNSSEKYLSRVSDELVKAAEEKIKAAAGEIDDDINWELVVEDDNLCISVEIIKFVEGADYMEEGGCGIDHEHLIFTEIITVGQ